MSSSQPPRSRLAALLKVLAAFAVMAGAVSLATTAFEWGVLTGLAAGAGGSEGTIRPVATSTSGRCGSASMASITSLLR